jgi:hypothetical protein
MEHMAILSQELATASRLLSAAGDKHWHKYVADCRARVAAGNYSGVEKLLRAYGGMGSLNDVQGASDSDHALLQGALSRSYELAISIRRLRERGDT